jgi:hypothetical protein
MQIHHYDPASGLYLYAGAAQPDPMELDRARRTLLATREAKACSDYAKALKAGIALEAAEAALSEARGLAAAAVEALEPAHWLIPAHATASAPPAVAAGQQLRFIDGGWRVEAIPEPEPVEEPEPPEPTEADLSAAARRRRDTEIAGLRWVIERHADETALGLDTTLSAPAFTTLLQHVQALRDVPHQPGFPADIAWPVLSTAPNTENT